VSSGNETLILQQNFKSTTLRKGCQADFKHNQTRIVQSPAGKQSMISNVKL